MYLGRALCTKETLPDFPEEMSGHRTFTSFRGLTGSQRTPGIWGVTRLTWATGVNYKGLFKAKNSFRCKWNIGYNIKDFFAYFPILYTIS